MPTRMLAAGAKMHNSEHAGAGWFPVQVAAGMNSVHTSGITCMSPLAPRHDTESGSKPLACCMKAAVSAGSTPLRRLSVLRISAKGRSFTVTLAVVYSPSTPRESLTAPSSHSAADHAAPQHREHRGGTQATSAQCSSPAGTRRRSTTGL